MIPIVESFSIDIKQEWPGCEDVSIVFNREVVIKFSATYVGPEPLTTMIDSLLSLQCYDEDEYIWYDEPGMIKFNVERASSSMLSMSIETDKAQDGEDIKRWELMIPYDIYRQGIIDAAIAALKKYGCKGFNDNWADGNSAYFIGELLSLLTANCKIAKTDGNYYSDIKSELQTLIDVIK